MVVLAAVEDMGLPSAGPAQLHKATMEVVGVVRFPAIQAAVAAAPARRGQTRVVPQVATAVMVLPVPFRAFP